MDLGLAGDRSLSTAGEKNSIIESHYAGWDSGQTFWKLLVSYIFKIKYLNT